MTDLRYPIGRFEAQASYTADDRTSIANRLSGFPSRLEDALRGLDKRQLDTAYREAGWSVRQVVHHLSDSHLNAYARIKLTLTEENPTIRPYDEKLWAITPEVKGDIAMSLDVLKAVHVKISFIIQGLTAADYARTYYHPENKSQATLDALLHMYAWHGDHHLAHITGLKSRMGW